MRVIRENHPIGRGGIVGVELTRRNLEVLLAKLNQNERLREDDPFAERSHCAIIAPSPEYLFVRAVENEEHYESREPGAMLVEGRLI